MNSAHQQPRPHRQHPSTGLPLDVVPLRGRALRFVLVDELRERETMTIADMVATLANNGYNLAGRASKIISDALRWELARGRIQRLKRGTYRYHHAPTTTARRIRIFATTCRTWLVATTRTQHAEHMQDSISHSDQTQPERHQADQHPADQIHGLSRPPWAHLGWLWTT